MEKSPRKHWKQIQAFWQCVNRLMREKHPQLEMIQSVITEEWFNDVHGDRPFFAFVLPPNLQVLYRTIHELENRRRTVSFVEFVREGREGQKTWECDMKLRILNLFFDSLLEQELNNFVNEFPEIKNHVAKKGRYLCEGWRMKFIKVS